MPPELDSSKPQMFFVFVSYFETSFTYLLQRLYSFHKQYSRHWWCFRILHLSVDEKMIRTEDENASKKLSSS